MTPDSLLGPLNDPSPRVVSDHLRELACTLPEDARASVTAVLLDGSHRARELGVRLALLAGDTAAILGALRQGSPLLRESAASALALVPLPAAADLREAYATASTRSRRRLVRGAVTHRRGDIVAVLLPVARELGHVDDAARLLRAAHYRDLAAHAADLLPTVEDARFLAVRVPELLLAEARALLTDPVSAVSYWERRGAAIAELVRAHPHLSGAVLDLIGDAEAAAPWNALLIAEPGAVAAYRAAAHAPEPSRAAARVLVERGGDDVVALLGDARPDIAAALLRAGDPVRLRPLVARAGLAQQSTPLRDRLLPEEVRVAAVEAAIAATAEAAPPELIARLGWPRAGARLLPLARGRDATVRAEAAAAVIASVGPDPARLAEALAELPRLRTEVDPVRIAVLAALAELPARTVATLSEERLDELRADALGALDVSDQTVRALLALAQRLVRTDRRAWAIATLEQTDPRGWLTNTAALTGPDAAAVADALLRGGALAPHLIAAEFGLTPAIEAHIGAALTSGPAGEDDDDLAELWLRPKATRSERIRILLADPSALLLERVDVRVRGSLADLLDPALLGTELEGRFSPYPQRWLPRITLVQTWTEPTRQRAAEVLAALLEEDPDDRLALAALAAIPEYRHRPLAALLGDPAAPDERAIAAGAAPTAVLATALRTDAAATAGSAAIRRAARTRTADVPALVDDLLVGPVPKLVAAKALLRAAEHAPRAAVPALRERILAAVGHHPDVSLTAVRIALEHPAEVVANDALGVAERVATDSDATRVLGTLRPQRLDPNTRDYVTGLLVTALASRDAEVARSAVLAAVPWLGTSAAIAQALWAQIADPEREDPGEDAWNGLLVSGTVTVLPGVIRTLIAAGEPGRARLCDLETVRGFGTVATLSPEELDAVFDAMDQLAEAGYRAGAVAVLLRVGGRHDLDPTRLITAVRGALGERISVAATVLLARHDEYPGPTAEVADRLLRLARGLEHTGTADAILALEIARLLRISDPESADVAELLHAGLASDDAEVVEHARRYEGFRFSTFGWWAAAPLAGVVYRP